MITGERAVNNRTAYLLIFTISIMALLFLIWLIYFRENTSDSSHVVAYLPYANASFNSISATLLILGYRAIRQQKVEQHKRLMVGAFASSTLFLVSYIIYHSLHGDTLFPGTGLIRPIYFFILITHIVLSAMVLPMILTTFFFSLSRQFEWHRKLARITLPIWLYVSITGVLIVILLKIYT